MATGSLSLDSLWIHDASNLEDSVELGYRGLNEKRSYEGSVALFANGRLRAITGPGKSKTYSVQLKFTPRATIDALEGYMNTPVMLRDQRGRRMYGQMFDLDIGEDLLPGDQETVVVGSVTFSVEELTMDDEV